MALSFATDIRPLFRAEDIDCMKSMGIDLQDPAWMCVPANAQSVYGTLSDGTMPPDEPWPAGSCFALQKVDGGGVSFVNAANAHSCYAAHEWASDAACFVYRLERQQAIEEGAVAPQCLPQVFSGYVVALGPLLFQSCALGGELLGDALHHIGHEAVGLFYGLPGSSTNEV